MSAQEALSALAWWREAGVDVLVGEEPRDWLAASAPAAAVAPQPIPEPAPTALPATLGEFRGWLAEVDTLPDGSEPARRLPPEGDPASGLMILLDAPEREDATAGRLLAGDVGILFDNMLRAIGRDRGSIYLATLCQGRPLAGRLDATAEDGMAAIARHHVALAVPRRLLIMGEAASRAILGTEASPARTRLHTINHSGVMVEAVVTIPPRILLQQPSLKARAWRDLRLVAGMEG